MSSAARPAGRRSTRRLLTPAGCFELRPSGWLAVWLTETVKT